MLCMQTFLKFLSAFISFSLLASLIIPEFMACRTSDSVENVKRIKASVDVFLMIFLTFLCRYVSSSLVTFSASSNNSVCSM